MEWKESSIYILWILVLFLNFFFIGWIVTLILTIISIFLANRLEDEKKGKILSISAIIIFFVGLLLVSSFSYLIKPLY